MFREVVGGGVVTDSKKVEHFLHLLSESHSRLAHLAGDISAHKIVFLALAMRFHVHQNL